MESPMLVDLGRIAQDLQIRRVQVESVVQLLDEGNSVPFITRYRKERTGNLGEPLIREIRARVSRLRELGERKETILKAIQAQEKLTEELSAHVRGAENPKRLEDLYLPFKPKKRTKAIEAREKGLEALALRVWIRDETLTDMGAAAAEYMNPEKGLDSVEKVYEGVQHILAESINELAAVRDVARRVAWRTGKIVTSKQDNVSEAQGADFRDYFSFTEPVNHVPPHRILAINRGEKENVLKVKVEVSQPEMERALFTQLPLEGHPQRELFSAAALDGLNNLLLPSLEREIRRELTELAERHAVDVFARNLRSLLLQPPIDPQRVLAIDPGFRTGCKVAVLDENGKLLDHDVIYPHAPQNRRAEAKLKLKDLVAKHEVGVVAIGNGTACRETEELVAEVIAEGTYFHEHPGETIYPHAPVKTGLGGRRGERSTSQAGRGSASPQPAEKSAAAEEATVSEATPEVQASAPPVEPLPMPDEVVGESGIETVGIEMSPAEHEASPFPETGLLEADVTIVEEEAVEVDLAVSQTVEPEGFPAGGDVAGENAPEPSTTDESDSGIALTEESKKDSEGDADFLPPIMGGGPEDEEEPAKPEETPEPAPSETGGEKPAESGLIVESEVFLVADPLATGVEGMPVEWAVTSSEEPQVHDDEPCTSREESGDLTDTHLGTTVEVVLEGESSDSPSGTEPAQAAESAAATPTSAVGSGESSDEEKVRPIALDFTHPPVGPKPKAEQKPRPQRAKEPPPPIAPHAADPRLAQLCYVIVNEAGASAYSTSTPGKDELPELDTSTRVAVSIGRRLLDPLAELVKIEPQNIGVGLYQHDMEPAKLKDSLDQVIESSVNFVGVDLNEASEALLRRVSGLNPLIARRLVERREKEGSFRSREEIKLVEGAGDSVFAQSAGFLKIKEGDNPLDRTWVHPEHYEVAGKLLAQLGFDAEALKDPTRLEAIREKFQGLDFPAVARELAIGEPTLREMCEALADPNKDPREDLPKPIFKRGVLKLEDLSAGMELKGTVLNVVDFGAFVDIGLKDSGLVHISQLANRYIKSPHDMVSVGDVVSVWVMAVDTERKRVSLTMVPPGTERQRTAGPRRGGGGPRDEGSGPEGGGGGGRPPREDRPPRDDRRGSGGGGGGSGGPGGRREGPRGRASGSSSERSSGETGAGAPGEPAQPQRSMRIPGPPQRMQGHRGGQRRGPGGPGRSDRDRGSQQQGDASGSPPPPRPRSKPSSPAPLPKEAITGNVPLRSFGQLKQLFEMRAKETTDTEGEVAGGQVDQSDGQSSDTASLEQSTSRENPSFAPPAPADDSPRDMMGASGEFGQPRPAEPPGPSDSQEEPK